MKPNSNVYGEPTQWYDQHFSQSIPSIYKNKKPNFGNNSRLDTAIANNRVVGGESLDKSISYCGLGNECDLSQPVSVFLNNNALTEIKTQRDVTNFFVWEKSEVYDFYSNGGKLYNTRRSAWTDNMSGDNVHKYINPICSIKPQNQVLEVRVQAYIADRTQVTNVDLDTYCTSTYVNYPLIRSVYVVCYYGANQNRDNGSLGTSIPGMRYMEIAFNIGLLEPYKYIDNTDIYNYAVWASDRQNLAILSGAASLSTQFIDSESACVYYGKDNIYTIVKSAETLDVYRDTRHESIDDIREYYLRQAACLGLYFTPKHTVALGGAFTDPDMYIGILDNNGVGHGDYLRGANTVNAPQNNLTDMYEVKYDPRNKDPNTYVKKTYLPGIISYAGRGEMVFIDPLQQYSMISDLITEFKQLNYDVQTDGKVFLYQEPLANIKECRRIFLNTTAFTTPSNIQVGGITFQSRGVPIAIYNRYFDLGTYFIFPQHGDYRDFEPYTKLSLYIPYCGITDLPLAVFSNHYITIKLAVDFRFGNIKAIVFVDDMEFTSIDGDASIDLGFSALASAEFSVNRKEAVYAKQRNLSMGINSVLGNIAGTTISAVFHNPAGAVAQGLMGVANGLRTTMAQKYTTQLEIDKQHADLRQISATSSNIEVTNCLTPLLIFSRPVNLPNFNEDNYAKLKGRVCSVQDNISNFHGLTIANDAILDGLSCTETEKEMILQALEEGIILD